MHMLVGLCFVIVLYREIYFFYMAKLCNLVMKNAVNKLYTGCAEIKKNNLDSKGKIKMKKCIIQKLISYRIILVLVAKYDSLMRIFKD